MTNAENIIHCGYIQIRAGSVSDTDPALIRTLEDSVDSAKVLPESPGSTVFVRQREVE
jgi:hypothetical protein